MSAIVAEAAYLGLLLSVRYLENSLEDMQAELDNLVRRSTYLRGKQASTEGTLTAEKAALEKAGVALGAALLVEHDEAYTATFPDDFSPYDPFSTRARAAALPPIAP